MQVPYTVKKSHLRQATPRQLSDKQLKTKNINTEKRGGDEGQKPTAKGETLAGVLL
jgi:hypothetical protein